MSSHVAAADCEADSGRWLAQPINALSSLAATAAGLWVVSRATEAAPARRRVTMAAGGLIAANGPGGLLYHGPGGRFGGWLHDAARVGRLVAVALGETADAAGRPPDVRLVGASAALAAGALAARPRWSAQVQAAAGGVVALAVGTRAARAHRSPDTLGPIALLGVGALVHARSRTGCRWCRPHSILQGHALWHLLSAAALGWWGDQAARRPLP
jgi:hypothetical protein